MNIFGILRNDLLEISDRLKKNNGINLKDNFTVEVPKEEKFGDLSTNIAMVSAKELGKNPRELANLILEELGKIEYIEKSEIAGPGFINIYLSKSIFHKVLSNIVKEGNNYGNIDIGNGIKVNVEYVSANPTGPMHIGHASNACYGDSLALLLQKAGYEVTKEYYINDAGGQIEVLAKSAYYRYLEALGHSIEIPKGCYPGEYLIEVGSKLKNIYGNGLYEEGEEKAILTIKPIAIEHMMKLIKEDLHEIGIYHDIFTSEYSLQKRGMIEKGLKMLEDKGLLYKGVLNPPKGKIPDDWEEREQTLFKSTEFGDDIDRALVKSDGSYTYFAGDIGLVLDKIERGYDVQIYVLGADHLGYISRLKSLVSALSGNKVKPIVQAIQLVSLMENDQPLKMSKRAGTFVTIRDVVEMVGKDVLRIMMALKKPDMSMNFDVAKLKEMSKDNPVFYISYAHARCKSILRTAAESMPNAFEKFNKSTSDSSDLSNLNSDEDISLIKKMAMYPKIIEQAALNYEPHRVINYAYDLASDFHNFWAKGKSDYNLKFIVHEDEELTCSRLCIVQGVANIISSAMLLCNVNAPEYM